MIDIKQALRHAQALLASTSHSAPLDAEVLLAHALNTSRTFLFTYPERLLSDEQQQIYQELVQKRHHGWPIAYLIGQREFWSLPLHVSNHTLIPRPETELLVELALTHGSSTHHARVLDLGTGTGAVALAIASERPHWEVLACDINPHAVQIAKDNAARLGLNNVKIVCSNWFTSLPKQLFDMIVSNPPYIAENDPHLKQGDVQFEPEQALVSGPDGLSSLTHLIKQSHDYLVPGGLLLLEHGFDQKNAVGILLNQLEYQNVTCWHDNQGHDRVSGGWRIHQL